MKIKKVTLLSSLVSKLNDIIFRYRISYTRYKSIILNFDNIITTNITLFRDISIVNKNCHLNNYYLSNLIVSLVCVSSITNYDVDKKKLKSLLLTTIFI